MQKTFSDKSKKLCFREQKVKPSGKEKTCKLLEKEKGQVTAAKTYGESTNWKAEPDNLSDFHFTRSQIAKGMNKIKNQATDNILSSINY